MTVCFVLSEFFKLLYCFDGKRAETGYVKELGAVRGCI